MEKQLCGEVNLVTFNRGSNWTLNVISGEERICQQCLIVVFVKE